MFKKERVKSILEIFISKLKKKSRVFSNFPIFIKNLKNTALWKKSNDSSQFEIWRDLEKSRIMLPKSKKLPTPKRCASYEPFTPIFFYLSPFFFAKNRKYAQTCNPDLLNTLLCPKTEKSYKIKFKINFLIN